MEIDRNKILVPFVAVLTIIAVGMVLKVAQSVVLPLMIAWLLSYIVGPLINVMAARRVPTPLSTMLVLTLLLFVCYLGGIFLYGRVTVFVGEYPRYQEKLATIIQDVSSRWQHGINPFGGIDWPRQIGSWLGAFAGNVLSFISNLVMVMIFLVFLLLGKPYFKYKLRKALPQERAVKVDEIVTGIARQISRYLYIQTLISLITGTLVWMALTALKVDFPLTWGALAFFLNFIPTIGSIVASVPPVLLALVQYYPQVWPAVTVAVVLTSIQMVIGNGVAPKVMGDKLNLSPVVVLLSLIFWGWLWGITGAILSIPIASSIKIVCENVEPLRPLSIMMGSGKRFRDEFARQNA